MKKLKVICITMLICLLFSACGVQNLRPDVNLPSTPYPVTPTPTLEPSVSPSVSPSPSASAECVCRYGIVKSVQYHPIKVSDENMDVPILVKDCTGRYLVVVWINDDIELEYKDFNTHRNAIETVVAYLDISYGYLADDWIYSVLNVTEPGAVHIYVTDEELAKLKAWDVPEKVVNYVDVLESQAYKKYGTLTLDVWHCGDDFEPVALPK